MAQTIGKNRNINDTAVLSDPITLNSATTLVVRAENRSRTFFAVSNPSPKSIWLKLQNAVKDNIKKGIEVRGRGYWEMPIDNVYIGEISAISDSGTPDVFITEY